MIRAVFDPGVLIAALISSRGAPAELLRLWIDGAFEMIVSPRLLEELRDVLKRPKFHRYVSEEEAARYVQGLARLALVVFDPVDVPPVTADPGDDYIVALAGSARVDVIVSGDTHLLSLEAADPEVVSPRDLVDRLS